ncbi:T-cell surface glycoprotein CD3 epsilon chain isoform X2 [Sphaeramia orbicularis]|uniref:T-cell surface glycoprotein CD3 epsilon chain isoform X2 n=1 Tax=Sphaeramia orbicularis TaxID=375764 RepID=UPI0011802E6F|nr:T-cell surface glycoprotein CD3 epsilon chain isoform X2 [Sphaeramia orbicularis]
MDFRVVFAILLLSVATVKAQDVSFWGATVTMTCPGSGSWHMKGKSEPLAENTDKLEMKYAGNQDIYCQYGDDSNAQVKYYFYIQGKACETCFEVDALLFLVVIVVDLLGTIGLMLVIYSCTKKRSSAGPAPTSKPPARSRGQGPPVPSPDYEQLNPLTRTADTYSAVNRMG